MDNGRKYFVREINHLRLTLIFKICKLIMNILYENILIILVLRDLLYENYYIGLLLVVLCWKRQYVYMLRFFSEAVRESHIGKRLCFSYAFKNMLMP